MDSMPVWLSVLLGIAGVIVGGCSPFILRALNRADRERTEMKADVKEIRVQTTATNGTVVQHSEWIRGHEQWSKERESRLDGSIKGIEDRERTKSRPPARKRK